VWSWSARSSHKANAAQSHQLTTTSLSPNRSSTCGGRRLHRSYAPRPVGLALAQSRQQHGAASPRALELLTRSALLIETPKTKSAKCVCALVPSGSTCLPRAWRIS
jgi:hypothetical protein